MSHRRPHARSRSLSSAVVALLIAATTVIAPVAPSAAATDPRPILFGFCGAAFLDAGERGTLARTTVLSHGDGGTVVADVQRAADGRDRLVVWRLDAGGTPAAAVGTTGRVSDLGTDAVDVVELVATGAATDTWAVADTTTTGDATVQVLRVGADGRPAGTPLSLTGHRLRAAAPHPSGGLLVATVDDTTGLQRLSRITAGGALDTTFDGDGHVDLPSSPAVGAVASGATGIAAAGADGSSATVWLLGADGAPVTSFDGDGRSDATLASTGITDLRLDADAVTVLATTDAVGVATLRLRLDGAPDATNGPDGVATATTDTTRGLEDVVFAADGGIVGLNTLFSLSDRRDLEVHRLTPTLARHPGFAGGEMATFTPRSRDATALVFPTAVSDAPEADVLVAGTRISSGVRQPVVARLTPSGDRDGHPWCDLAAGDGADPVTMTRASGNDRYATAAAVSELGFAPGVDTVLVATGEAFPDALAGGPVASLVDGPVLLVRPDSIPSSTATELQRLRPRRIVVLGGTAAVSAAVATQLAGYATEPVERRSGANRYATAADISRAFFPTAVETVYVATGENFPDALSGVPAAAADGAPILLVTRDSIPAATADELARLRPTTIVVLGGVAAVSEGVATQLGQGGAWVTRVSGPSRYATSSEIVRTSVPSSTVAFLATGRSFPDALAGGALAGLMRAPVTLVDEWLLEGARFALATQHDPGRLVLLGGTAVIDPVLEGTLGREGLFAYRVITINPDATAARWNPCRPLHWVANVSGAYPTALDDLLEGARRVEQLTGIDLVFDGTTTEPEPANPGDRDDPGRYPPVWVGWTDLGPFTGSGVLGRVTNRRWTNARGQQVITTALVRFNANAIGQVAPGYDGADVNWGEVILHEFGHLIGLDHAEGLMAPSPLGGPVYFRPPDLRGLEALGTQRGCVLDP